MAAGLDPFEEQRVFGIGRFLSRLAVDCGQLFRVVEFELREQFLSEIIERADRCFFGFDRLYLGVFEGEDLDIVVWRGVGRLISGIEVTVYCSGRAFPGRV